MEAREEHQLLADLHLGIEPTLLGHVSDSTPRVEIDRRVTECHPTRIRFEHTENDAHRRRLACAVATDEAEDFSGCDGECHVIKGDDVAIPFG
ncbi:Uncharacterised protein [Mycobacteroides abscessus subsp. abscessus]|nr:Uncharacterised protein [Mycobacteroides abscessus subsp. abscessus]